MSPPPVPGEPAGAKLDPVTETVDPERYLRMLGERTLLEGGQGNPFAGPVDRAASALVAVGALDEALADSVVADYGLARELRGDHHPARFGHRQRPGPPALLTPPRVVAGPFEVAVSWGALTVRWVRLGSDGTEIAVAGRLDRPRAGRLRRGPSAGPSTVQLADDRGTSVLCHFGGSHGGTDFTGKFSGGPPLAPDTAWLDIDGTRVELPAPSGPPPHVRMEALPARSSALSYLWHQLAASRGRFGPPGEDTAAAVDALVAVGALDPDDPELAVLRQSAVAVGSGWPSGSPVPTGLPDPWARLLAQGPPPAPSAAKGVEAVVAVGAVAGPVDGVAVAVDAIAAEPDGLSMDVVVSPGGALHPRFAGTSRHTLEWWVEDDLGVVRLGHVGNCSGSEDKMQADIEFPGGLDAAATELRIMPTGTTERAVVTVALPWASGQRTGAGA